MEGMTRTLLTTFLLCLPLFAQENSQETKNSLSQRLWDELHYSVGKETLKEAQKEDEDFLAANLDNSPVLKDSYKENYEGEDSISLKMAAPVRKETEDTATEAQQTYKRRKPLLRTRVRSRLPLSPTIDGSGRR